ncbi:MAG TPA: hypothetical protein VJ965_01685 [Anaerolineales bacterium]|nr:hypothetical protein [Anaerolineales bacterium]
MDEAQSKVIDAYKIASRGNFDHARLILEETLYDHPKHTEAWLLLADLSEDSEEARQCYQMVLEIAPENWVAQQRMKILFSQQNPPPEISYKTESLFEEDDEEALDTTELVAPEILDDLLSDTSQPSLKESYQAHKKLVQGVGIGLVALLGIGVISWIASVGFIVWKTGFLAWFGF